MSDASLPHCNRCGRVEYDCICGDNEAEWRLYFVHMREYRMGWRRTRPRPPLQYGAHIDSLPKQHRAPRIRHDRAVMVFGKTEGRA